MLKDLDMLIFKWNFIFDTLIQCLTNKIELELVALTENYYYLFCSKKININTIKLFTLLINKIFVKQKHQIRNLYIFTVLATSN